MEALSNKSAGIKSISNTKKNGLDEWNDRLDENLEPNDRNDLVADANAKKFSEKNNGVDQPRKQETPDI